MNSLVTSDEKVDSSKQESLESCYRRNNSNCGFSSCGYCSSKLVRFNDFLFYFNRRATITNCQWGQDVSYADLTVNNFGTESATIDEVKVNGELVTDVSVVTGSADLNAGENVVFRITESFSPSNSYRFSISTTKGTRVEYVSKAPSATPATPNYTVDFVLGIGGLSLSPGDGDYSGDVAISATADTDYVFNQWQSTGSITFDNAGSASTTATINGAGTITATFTYVPLPIILDSLEFDPQKCTTPDILNVYDDVYAIAYSGDGDDGFLKTVKLNS